jgi:hypothetical protein
MPRSRIAKTAQIQTAISVSVKAGRPVIAALDDVQRDAGQL